MATYEHTALQQYKDQNGDMHLLYPITKAENVDGLYGDAALTGVPTAPTAATGTNTTQVATTAFVQQELEDVKKSVSDGKTAVANAITAKGVETATDATFAAMAANISAIESGGGIGLNVFTQETEPETKEGVWVQTANPHQSIAIGSQRYSNNDENPGKWAKVSTLPYNFYLGSAVVLNNEIHLLGSNYRGNEYKHYKWTGSEWVNMSTLPYPFCYGAAVVLNNEIHTLGGHYSAGDVRYHYKCDGKAWVKVSTLPYDFYNGSAVVLNNEIHLLGGKDAYTSHYKWTGSKWVKVSTLPYNFYNGSAVVLNNEIHLLGGKDAYTSHYKWTGSKWVKVSTLPYNFCLGSAVVLDNEIHILGGYDDDSTKHYKWNGSEWVSVTTLPVGLYLASVVSFNGKIHTLGGSYNTTLHCAISFLSTQHVGSKVSIYQNSSNTSGTYATNFISGVPITGENNKFPSGFDDIYYIDDSGRVEEAPTYYGDGTQWIKFKN